MISLFVTELFIYQQRRQVVSQLIEFRLTIEAVLVYEADHVKFQYVEIRFNKSRIWENDVQVLLFNV